MLIGPGSGSWGPCLEGAQLRLPLHPPATKEMPLREGGSFQGTSSARPEAEKDGVTDRAGTWGVTEAALAAFMPERIEFIEIKKVRHGPERR